MNIGDLVKFKPNKKLKFGALTAVKFLERTKIKIGPAPGVIVNVRGNVVDVMFESCGIMVLNKLYLEIVDEG